MVCSVCFECGHNKRTCPLQLKAPIGVDLSTIPLTSERDIPTDLEMKIAQDLCDILDKPTTVEMKIAQDLCDILDAPTPVEVKIAKELSSLLDEKKTTRKCSLCGECGHNKRTCPIKCEPCSVQVTPSEKKVAKELISILDEPCKLEVITFANGETMSIDLGP